MKQRHTAILRNWILVIGLLGVFGLHLSGQTPGDQSLSKSQLIKSLAGGAELREELFKLPGGEVAAVFKTVDNRIIFFTDQLAAGVEGYNGPIVMAVMIDSEGRLLATRIHRHRETEKYLGKTNIWRQGLVGKNLFTDHPFAGVDAVTGATFSSEGITGSLVAAGRALKGNPMPQDNSFWLSKAIVPIYLIISTFLAVLSRLKPGIGMRVPLLLAAVIIGGIALNLQYSVWHVLELLAGNAPPVGMGPGFLLIIIIPLACIAVRKLYCAFLCPFGALQELLARFTPKQWKRTIPYRLQWTRYTVLTICLLLWYWNYADMVSSADPLGSAWNLESPPALAVAALSLIVSPFLPRAWCRFLCPAGAFLSLANHPIFSRFRAWFKKTPTGRI